MSIFGKLEKYLKKEKPYKMKPDGTKMSHTTGRHEIPKMSKVNIGVGTKLSHMGHGIKALTGYKPKSFKVPKY